MYELTEPLHMSESLMFHDFAVLGGEGRGGERCP